MKQAILVSCVLSLFGAASVGAEPRHVLVLRADGNADTATRAKVDAQVLKLAKAAEGNVEAGEISFADAATAVGCSGTEVQCRDDVLSTMGVDEVISINVTTMPSGDTRIIVHRIPKGSPIRDAQTTVPGGQPVDTKIAGDIGPMFGITAPPTKAATTPPPAKATTPPPPPPLTPAGTSAPLPAFGDPNHTAPPPQTAQVDANTNTVTAAPNGQVTTTPEGRTSNRPLAGLAISGGMVVLAIVMWAEASSTQSDINAAPTRSPADFRNLQDLESKGDTYATLGNLFFIGGLVVGGVSGYYFWKDRHAPSSAQARLAPAVFAHGAGIALTIGGAP